jgi:hypothetical protein
MPIGSFMSPPNSYFALIAVLAIAVIALFVFLNSRWRFVDFYKTYPIRVHGGLRRFPNRITWLRTFSFDNYEYIVRGKRHAERFEFLTRNRDEEGGWTVKKLHLMDPRSGAIDLRVHTMELRPFKVSSADHHDMEVHATIEFQLDRDRLFRCFQYANLGVALLTRLEDFIRAQIKVRQNEDVAREIADIRAEIFQDMKKAEDTDIDQFKVWRGQNGDDTPPNPYFRGTQSKALGIHITALSLQVEQLDANHQVPAGDGGQQTSALMIPPKFLDNLRDMFSRGGADTAGANEALLRTMEMHTRENIAKHVSAAGKMFVISSDDLGMARNAVFRSSITAGGTGEVQSTLSPQDGEHGKDSSSQPEKEPA